ncbi:MAG: hypothetical protein AAGA54_20560 [Myxococcota bacterium]
MAPPVDDLEWEELEDPDAPAETAPAPAPSDATAPDAPAQPDAPSPAGPAEAAPTMHREQPTTPPPVEAEPEREIVELQPPAPAQYRPKRRPSLYGRTWVGPLILAGNRVFGFGVAATQFVVPWFGIGAEVLNVFHFDPLGDFFEFRFTPIATLLMLPRRRFSPLAWAGFGVDAFNKELGTYGRWAAGTGVVMLLGQRAMLQLGVEFDGRVPESRWNENFVCGPFRSNCSMSVAPQIGFTLAL